MNYISTRGGKEIYSFEKAVTLGIAPDGGLFLPEDIPAPAYSLQQLSGMPRHRRIASLLAPFAGGIPMENFHALIESVFNFPIVTRNFDEHISILELFHGPTLAFKDFGARFLAQVLSFFVRHVERECVILVATSGDTGSAVAQAFHGIDNCKVALLYPSGKVSKLQEMQLTTFDKNITAFEITGTFDDCQRMVKTAFADNELKRDFFLTSANSINIARLLPQAMYYIESFIETYVKHPDITFVVPSGNLGNLTAGLLAMHIAGLPVSFVSALNSNKGFFDFLRTGKYSPKASIETLSNAMDVGNPSNLERITSMYPVHTDIAALIRSYYFDDAATLEGIRAFNAEYNHIIDPHTAVGYLGALQNLDAAPSSHHIILSTAHPAKFPDVIQQAADIAPETPARLLEVLKKEKKSIPVHNDYGDFKKALLHAITKT